MQNILDNFEDYINNLYNTKILSKEYAGQYLFMSLIFLIDKSKDIKEVDKALHLLITHPKCREYDKIMWKSDPLSFDRAHLTYHANLAWAIANYKLKGGDIKYDDLFNKCCNILYKELKVSENILTFPGKPIFIIDNLTAILALHLHDKIFNRTDYQLLIANYLNNIKTDSKGIIISMLSTSQYKVRKNIRGSQFAYAIFILSKIDKYLAYKYYLILKKYFIKHIDYLLFSVYGIKEFEKDPKSKFYTNFGDAGIVIKNISGVGTLFGLGCAKIFNDFEWYKKFYKTVNLGLKLPSPIDMTFPKIILEDLKF